MKNTLLLFASLFFFLTCTHALVSYNYVKQWPKCIVPYEPNPSHVQWSNIIKAMNKFAAATNVRFVPRTDQTAYIKFEKDDSSAQHTEGLGYVGSPYIVNIKYDVRIEHELGHVLGFGHEHERSDRDTYLDILLNNVDNNDAIASQLVGKESSSDEIFVTNFDENSIMIYWCSAAGKSASELDVIKDFFTGAKQIYNNKWRTMSIKTNPKKIWGSPVELSPLDIQGINSFYKNCAPNS